ncbi:MAG: hypothetical protein MJA83_16910, partial [Gammaproteobacteria bacterium]|nr:hypothetical protein [Gammaproteobacteria bacterium]
AKAWRDELSLLDSYGGPYGDDAFVKGEVERIYGADWAPNRESEVGVGEQYRHALRQYLSAELQDATNRSTRVLVEDRPAADAMFSAYKGLFANDPRYLPLIENAERSYDEQREAMRDALEEDLQSGEFLAPLPQEGGAFWDPGAPTSAPQASTQPTPGNSWQERLETMTQD